MVCPKYIVFPAVSIVESVHTIAITCSCHTNCLIKKNTISFIQA